MMQSYLNNANIIAQIAINPHVKPSTLNKQIFNLLQEILPEYLHDENAKDTLQPQDLIVNTLTGGLSNHLLTVQIPVVSHPSSTKSKNNQHGTSTKTILLRLHNEQEAQDTSTSSGTSSSIVDRDAENKISAQLSSHGMAPIYYGRFANGRVEEFYERFRPLSHKEMSNLKFTRAIAIHLAKLHKLQLRCVISNPHSAQGEIWKRIEDWIQLANDEHAIPTTSENEKQLIQHMMNEIQEEWAWLKKELGPTNAKSAYTSAGDNMSKARNVVVAQAVAFCSRVRAIIAISSKLINCIHLLHKLTTTQHKPTLWYIQVVFTHMDCQSLNILTPENAPTLLDEGADDEDAIANIRLIDFEYAGMNPRAADLANTFAEFCDMNNLIPDYARQYPTEHEQDVFFMAYIRENDAALAKELDGMSKDSRDLFLSTMREMVGKYSLFSHLGWACWAVVQYSASSIAFDYITYAKVRMEGYRFFKNRHFNGKQPK